MQITVHQRIRLLQQPRSALADGTGMDSHSKEEGSHDKQSDSSLDDVPSLVSDGGEELLSKRT